VKYEDNKCMEFQPLGACFFPAFSVFSLRKRRADMRMEMWKRLCRFPVAHFMAFIQIVSRVTRMREMRKAYRILIGKPEGE
jgi:hypothetical protein